MYLNEFRARLEAVVEHARNEGYVNGRKKRTWRCVRKKPEPLKKLKSREQHGMKGTPTHVSWRCMIQRCTDPRRKVFPYYGGIGVTVCDRWRSFKNFLADMDIRPAETTLSRFADSGNYEPGNCAWHTRAQQLGEREKKKLIA